MGLSKLLDKLQIMLNLETNKKKKYRKELKVLLKELKIKENKVRKQIETSKDERKRNRLQKELDIVHGQRIKGIEALRQAKKKNLTR